MGVINTDKSLLKNLNTSKESATLLGINLQNGNNCKNEKKDCGCNTENVKKISIRSKKMKWSKKIRCKKEKAVCEIVRFVKSIKAKLGLINCSGSLKKNSVNCEKVSIEPTIILAQLSAKMLKFETKINNLPCYKNANCRLAILMNTVKRNILEQLICGPQANKALFKTVKDVTNIENLLKRMKYRCLCKQLCTKGTEDLDDTEDIANSTFKRETTDKSVNTDDADGICSCKKEDKETNCDPIDQDNYLIDHYQVSSKHCSYSKRRGNCTRATEKENNHEIGQIRRGTSTSEITFVGDIAYPEEIRTDDNSSQNNHNFTCNKTFQVTSVCVSYKNERTSNELDKLPKLNHVTKDCIFETNIYNENLHDIKEVGQKSYMTKIQGVNIVAETKTNYNSDELKVIFNDEITSTYTTTGYSSQAEANVIAFKQEIFDQVKKVATQIIRNFHKEKETNVISPLNVPEHIYI